MIPKRLFSFKELETRCTLEHIDAVVLRIIMVIPISGGDTFRIIGDRLVCVR